MIVVVGFGLFAKIMLYRNAGFVSNLQATIQSELDIKFYTNRPSRCGSKYIWIRKMPTNRGVTPLGNQPSWMLKAEEMQNRWAWPRRPHP